MKDRELKASLERAEAAYETLVRTRASLGTVLAEAIWRAGGLPEFRRRREDLCLLLRSADIRRTKLKVELLGQRPKKVQEQHRRTAEDVRSAGATQEEAKKACARAVNVEHRVSLEVQRFKALHRAEMERLGWLVSETVEREEEEEEVAARWSPRLTLYGSRFRPAAPLLVGGC